MAPLLHCSRSKPQDHGRDQGDAGKQQQYEGREAERARRKRRGPAARKIGRNQDGPADLTWKGAGEYILARLDGHKVPTHYEVDYALVVRESTPPPTNKEQ